MRNADWSEWLQGGFRILLVQHPKRTTFGICAGVAVSMVVDAFKAFIPPAVNVSAFSDFRLAVVGILAAHVPTFWGRSPLPDHVEDMFVAVRRAVEEGQLSRAQTRMLYIQVCHKVVAKAPIHANDGTPIISGD